MSDSESNLTIRAKFRQSPELKHEKADTRKKPKSATSSPLSPAKLQGVVVDNPGSKMRGYRQPTVESVLDSDGESSIDNGGSKSVSPDHDNCSVISDHQAKTDIDPVGNTMDNHTPDRPNKDVDESIAENQRQDRDVMNRVQLPVDCIDNLPRAEMRRSVSSSECRKMSSSDVDRSKEDHTPPFVFSHTYPGQLNKDAARRCFADQQAATPRGSRHNLNIFVSHPQSFADNTWGGKCNFQASKQENPHEPRTFSVHTASPSMESDQQQYYRCHRNETAAGFGSRAMPPDHHQDGADFDTWFSDRYSQPIGSPNFTVPSSRCAEDLQAFGPPPVQDPAVAFGEGIPPYNFDLFSEVWSRYAPEGSEDDDSHSESSEIFSGEDVRNVFDGPAGRMYPDAPFGDDGSDDDAVIPDYNFDLFSEVTNRWRPPSPHDMRDTDSNNSEAGCENTMHDHDEYCGSPVARFPVSGAEMALVVRKKSLNGRTSDSSYGGTTPRSRSSENGRYRCRSPTLEVEECNGNDEDLRSTNSCDSPGAKVTSTKRLVECEVISYPDEVGGIIERSKSTCW